MKLKLNYYVTITHALGKFSGMLFAEPGNETEAEDYYRNLLNNLKLLAWIAIYQDTISGEVLKKEVIIPGGVLLESIISFEKITYPE